MSMMCCVLVYELHFCMCVVVHAHIIGIWEPFLVGSVAVIKLYVPSNLRESFIWLRHHDNSLSLREAMTGTLSLEPEGRKSSKDHRGVLLVGLFFVAHWLCSFNQLWITCLGVVPLAEG